MALKTSEQKEWAFDGGFDFAMNHEDAENNRNKTQDCKCWQEIRVGKEVDGDYHGAKNSTANK